MTVVAISGWKKSGKDLLANHLVSNFGAVRVAFADPLKDRVAEEFGIPREWLDDQEKKEMPLLQYPVNPEDGFSLAIAKLMFGEFRSADGKRPICYGQDPSFVGAMEDGSYEQLYWTPRALAIFKGSGNRAVTSKYWVSQAVKKIKESGSELVVMSDVRFKSEVSQLRDAFGQDLVTVRVNRFDTCESTDASERDLDHAQFDHMIENRGTVTQALTAIENVVRSQNALFV